MRKTKLFLLVLLVFFLSSHMVWAQTINVVIDQAPVGFTSDSGAPFIDSNSRTLVPFRVVLEKFGCTVEWNKADQIAIARKDGIEVQVPIGKAYIYINGTQKINDTSAQIKDGRTYLPIRAVLEAFGASIAWNPYSHAVIIDSTGNKITILNPLVEDLEAAKVKEVIDGDTFVLENGEKVRMIGIDSPEVTGPYTQAEFYGEEASAYTKSILTGTTVYLDKDTSNVDQYGRLLRFVYLEDGTFINLLLIQKGYAEAGYYPPDLKYLDQFDEAEQQAINSNLGMWSQ